MPSGIPIGFCENPFGGFMPQRYLTFRTFLGWCWLAFGCSSGDAQWQTQVTQTKSHFRGLCAVDRNVAWASGTQGTILHTTNGGETWHVEQVPGAEELDFRDIEALDGETAWALSSGDGPESCIYKTTDAGQHWTLQFRNEKPKAFFDALSFWDPQHGIALSDPVDGQFLFMSTTNGGTNWERIKASIPVPLTNESSFAASGTCLAIQGQSNVWFATGGAARARVFRSTDRGQTWSVSDPPIKVATDSMGIFSLAFRDAHNGVAIGGDHMKPEQTGDNLAFTRDGGRTWQKGSGFFPRGFRSAVSWVRAEDDWLLVAVGPSGSDISKVDGPWRKLDDEKYNTLSVARFDANAIWAAGSNGRIARLLQLPK
jgi:photosystem II stability/assembly factor-like uncharacterized protein